MSPIEPRNDGHILVVATSNEGKLRELSAILPPSTSLLTLRDIELDSPEETGRTFLDNAMLKAQYASEMSGYPAIADDSGLTVDTLDADRVSIRRCLQARTRVMMRQ
ncbi:MAG: non-canonical purine NTP pyrophosphatase [Thermomicrobiales bacterium]